MWSTVCRSKTALGASKKPAWAVRAAQASAEAVVVMRLAERSEKRRAEACLEINSPEVQTYSQAAPLRQSPKPEPGARDMAALQLVGVEELFLPACKHSLQSFKPARGMPRKVENDRPKDFRRTRARFTPPAAPGPDQRARRALLEANSPATPRPPAPAWLPPACWDRWS